MEETLGGGRSLTTRLRLLEGRIKKDNGTGVTSGEVRPRLTTKVIAATRVIAVRGDGAWRGEDRGGSRRTEEIQLQRRRQFYRRTRSGRDDKVADGRGDERGGLEGGPAEANGKHDRGQMEESHRQTRRRREMWWGNKPRGTQTPVYGDLRDRGRAG